MQHHELNLQSKVQVSVWVSSPVQLLEAKASLWSTPGACARARDLCKTLGKVEKLPWETLDPWGLCKTLGKVEKLPWETLDP